MLWAVDAVPLLPQHLILRVVSAGASARTAVEIKAKDGTILDTETLAANDNVNDTEHGNVEKVNDVENANAPENDHENDLDGDTVIVAMMMIMLMKTVMSIQT